MSVLLLWGMMWSLKFTGAAGVKTARLLLLQINKHPSSGWNLLLAVRKCGCTRTPLEQVLPGWDAMVCDGDALQPWRKAGSVFTTFPQL